MRRACVVGLLSGVLMSLAGIAASAQEPVDEIPFYDTFENDFKDIVVDTSLFYVPVGDGITFFGEMSRYDFGFVSYKARGFDERYQRVYLAELELSSGIGRYPDYNLYTALSTLTPQGSHTYAAHVSGSYSPLTVDFYGVMASEARQGWAATYTYSERRYRSGLRLRYAGETDNGWYYSVAARGRWGMDAFIDGVFSDISMASVAVEKCFAGGESLSAIVIAAYQARGLKGWTEREAYELTGDNMYNPYWGYYDGKIRNSRVRKELAPLAVINFSTYDSRGTNYVVTAGYRFGYRGRSGLAWWNAPNPSPDYYTNMPGHRAEPHVADALEEAWRSGRDDVLHVDWDGMCESNMLSPDGSSLYVADMRMERLNNLQLAFRAAVAQRNRLELDYGFRLRSDRSNFYREAADLLGGAYAHNRDPYTGAESDLGNAGRRVARGDRFDYDYDIVRREAVIHGGGRYRMGRSGVTFGAEIAYVSLERIGRFEKEGLAGALSSGRSGRNTFVPYNLFVAGRYGFTTGHRISAELYVGEQAPHFEDIFLSPDYSNRRAANRHTERVAGFNIDYRLSISYFAELQMTGFWMHTGGGTRIMRYYDDIYGAYCDLVMDDISKDDWGVEVGARISLAERLELVAAFSIGGNTYAGNPSLTIIDDDTGAVFVEGDTAYLEGFVHTPSPQTVVALALNYSTRSQWGFTAEWMYADRRYVTVNPVRRTARIVSLFQSVEERAACIRQERLPAAWVVNVGITKGFSLFGTRVFVSVSVDNLTGHSDIIYGGYEQMRIEDREVGGRTVYEPFPSRYNYAYPRTFLASITVSF